MTQSVLITGTSSGLGRATAKRFLAAGWNVVATMRDPDAETELSSLDGMLVCRLDVEQAGSIWSAIDAGIERFGSLDVLVNNAGFGAFGPLEATPIETIRRQFEVNLIGVLQTTQAALPYFRGRKSGTIVNVTSTSGLMTLPFGTLYHASKFAVEGATEALQYELAPLGIRVKLVEPGAIRTDFAGRSMAFNSDPSLVEYQPLLEAAMGAYGKTMGEASDPSLIAEIVFAAATDGTDRLRYVAGDDAIKAVADRAADSDEAYFARIRQEFGLPADAT